MWAGSGWSLLPMVSGDWLPWLPHSVQPGSGHCSSLLQVMFVQGMPFCDLLIGTGWVQHYLWSYILWYIPQFLEENSIIEMRVWHFFCHYTSISEWQAWETLMVKNWVYALHVAIDFYSVDVQAGQKCVWRLKVISRDFAC